jgi:hypothetical protein
VGTYNTIGVLKGPSSPSAAKADEASPEIVVTAQELSKLDALQMLLDVIGLIPGFGAPADILNAIISGARGDWLGAGLSLFGVVPVAGEAATAGKIAKNADRYAAAVAKVADEVLPHLPARVQDKLRPAIEAAKRKIDELGGKAPATPARPNEAPKAKEQARDGQKVKERKPGPCDHLRQGNGTGPYRGGAHSKTSQPRNDQRDSHHMPAKDASPLPHNDGPAIQMTPKDHGRTSSNGQMPGSIEYREAIAELIDAGLWRKAMAKEIADVRRVARQSGDARKYNEAMLEMMEYYKCLERNSLLR